MAATIGIIGAGLAGLCTAKTLKMLGFNVVVFEKEADVGGVWSASRRYPGLTTQNPRDTYAFSDFPMPDDYPEWPGGKQVQDYLEAYVERFGLRDLIHLGTEVVTAVPRQGEPAWSLTVRSRNDMQGQPAMTHVVDWLIVCNGIFSIPNVPNYPGADAFLAQGGRILHTSELNDITQVAGKDVLVLGYGKSSCDIANAIAAVSRSTTVIVRTLTWKIPKRLMNVLNFKHLFLTRLGEALFRYIEVFGFEKWLHGAGLPIRNSILSLVESVIAKQLQLHQVGLHPGKPLETIVRSTVSLVTDGFYEKIASGELQIKPGSHIVELTPGFARLSNGESIPADMIICGTGWDQRVPFFDASIVSRITDAKGNFLLYRSMLATGIDRLAFNGYNSSFFSQLNAEISALWLAEYIPGHLTLPPSAEREREIQTRLAWMDQRTGGKHSKGTNIVPFSVHHMDELLADINLRLPLTTRLKHWLVAINARDYASLMRRLLRRRGIDPRIAYAR